ncbi:hypothetical protein ACHAXA_008245, partial [Cyclostephanos tholiformis]
CSTMDLQAILDTPSSDDDEEIAGRDRCRSSTTAEGGGSLVGAAAIGDGKGTTVAAIGGGGHEAPASRVGVVVVGGGMVGIGAEQDDAVDEGSRPEDVVDRILLRDHRARRESNAWGGGGGGGVGGRSRYLHRGQEEEDDENDTDFGLNFDYCARDAQKCGDVKNMSSIMQHPLTRKDSGEQARQRQMWQDHHMEVYDHNGRQRREDRSLEYSFYDIYTADKNFLNRTTQGDGEKNKTTATGSNDQRTWQQQQEDDRDHDDEYDEDGILLSRMCMEYAENTERKLLRPSSNNAASADTNKVANNLRNVVSPLAVKRRMKPRVELMTKSRLSSWQSQGNCQQQHQQLQQHQPRFGFSGGIIQTKSMLSVPLEDTASLLKKVGGGNGTFSNAASGGENSGARTEPLPTALAVNSKFIAIGNQHGEIRVFDLYEQLKIILGRRSSAGEGVGDGTAAASSALGGKRNDTPVTAVTALGAFSSTLFNFGSVTSIDLSSQGDFLLAGYGTGQVILWDVIKGAILKTVDSHSSSICSARITYIPVAGDLGRRGMIDNEKIGAVIVDASGLVNKLIFSRGWLSAYSVETECLLDGTAGQILAMDALPPQDMAVTAAAPASQQTATITPYDNRIVLIALSSSKSSFAVSVEPKVNVLHRWARPSTERIDPTIGDDDRLTHASSSYASTYASSYASSSYLSTSTYQSTVVAGRKQEQQRNNVDSTPVPYLPCLSWGWALVCGGGHAITPILARAWGCCLQFLRASPPPSMEDDVKNNSATSGDDNAVAATIHWPAFGTHDEFDASAPVVALNWLGKRSLVYLTITNELIIIDTVIMTMQERLDFSDMKLVYAEFALSRRHLSTSSRFQQLNSNDCTTFMNSIRSSDNRLLVLCQGEIKEITALGMRQQIMSLEDGGQWLEALALALDHYESSIKSQEDNKRNDPSFALNSLDVMTTDPLMLTEDEVWMAELLMRYLILAIDNAPDSSPMGYSASTNNIPHRLNLAESHFEMLSGVCIEFCIVIRRLDLLFGPIFRCFYEARFINVFLDVMETYVLHDKLKYIAPEAMVLYVAHCKDMKDLSMVERCLLHIKCNLMDFDSILSLLKKHGLYTGLIYVYSSGLDNYMTPLEVLLDAVFDSADTAEFFYSDRRNDGILSNKFEQIGYKAILYLQYCFQGKIFPKGDLILPEERRQTLRPELFQILLREIYSSPKRIQSSQHPTRINSFRGIRALSYPYVRVLILVDTKAFLDCLALIFDDPCARFAQAQSQLLALGSGAVEYDTDNTITVMSSPDVDENGQKLLPDRQHLINILSSIIMSESLVDSVYHFGSMQQMTQLSTKAKHFFLDFLAKYLQLGVVTAPKFLTGEVVNRQCNKRGASEEYILELLHALQRSSYELDEVLYSIEKVHMTRGALFLHKLGVTTNMDREDMSEKCQHHFHRSIDCYLEDKDNDFKKGVFVFARKECSSRNAPLLKSVLIQRLPELVKLDSVLAAGLVAALFVEDIDMVLLSLKDIESGRVEYDFLHAILSGALDKVETVAAQELSANMTEKHHYLYLERMARFQPDNVYHYLSNNRNYRFPDALKLCQENNITDACALLLERTGDVSGAFKLMLQTFDTRMMTLRKTLQLSGASNIDSLRRKGKADVLRNEMAENEISRIKQILAAALDLCERNKNDHLTLDNDERGQLIWLHVLDRLVHVKTLLHNSNDSSEYLSAGISTVLSDLLLMALQRMISNVSLRELIQKITRDHAGSDLGELREMLVSMLKTYGSELDVCSSVVNVMHYDIRQMTYEKRRLKVRGSFVEECPRWFPKDVPSTAILEVGTSGVCRVRCTRMSQEMGELKRPSDKRISANYVSSLYRHRRNCEEHRSRRFGKRGRGRGGKDATFMTTSEYQVTARKVDTREFRQVGVLSEAQHFGGLF